MMSAPQRGARVNVARSWAVIAAVQIQQARHVRSKAAFCVAACKDKDER